MGASTIAAAVAVVAALALAGPAAAAFPGRDGQLAVQPEHGGGIVLASADGSGAHRICPTRDCVPVTGPSWSPDGRMIAFRARPPYEPSEVSAIYADGTCLRCDGRVGEPPAAHPAGRVSFARDGWTVAYTTRGGSLATTGVDGVGYRRLRRFHGRDPAWSANGRLAFSGRIGVHGRRQIVVTSRGLRHARRITGRGGRRPSWSPDGRRIAFVRSGRIFVVDADGRHLHRVSHGRGHAPAWSPDGRRIAFIRGRGGAGGVTTIGPRGRHPRLAGPLRGRSVDWQPRPTQPPPACAPLPHSRAVPVTGGGNVVSRGPLEFTTRNGDEHDTYTSYLACSQADGRWRQFFVETQQLSTDDVFVHNGSLFTTGGPFVAFVDAYSDKYFANVTIRTIDLRDGAIASLAPYQTRYGDCATTRSPKSLVRALRVTEGGFPAWLQTTCATVTSPPQVEVVAHDGRGTRVLDSGPQNAIGALRAKGNTVSWLHDGTRRSATLG